MNYEELYADLQSGEKKMKDAAANVQKLYKAVVKDTENGDIKSLVKNLEAYDSVIAAQNEAIANLKSALEGFDSRAYFEGGDFAGQMLALCKEKGIDVNGEYPVYEMFPYRVKVDTENQDVYIDRKKVSCMRPLSLVNTIKAGQEKLNKASFNALSFATELAAAYDLVVLKSGKQAGADMYLQNIYKMMTPMSRARKEYDQQSFAFDIARLYAAEIEEIKDGRRFQFGPSRNNNKAIRILDQQGREQFLATIRFF